MKISNGHFVAICSRVHRTNQRNLIYDFRRVRQQLGQLGTTLSTRTKSPRSSHQGFGGSVDEAELHIILEFCSVVSGKLGLGICQIHVRGTAMLKQ